MGSIFCRGFMGRTFLYHLQNLESPCDSVPLIWKMNIGFFWGKEMYLCPLQPGSSKYCFPSHPMATPGIPAVANRCYTGMFFLPPGFLFWPRRNALVACRVWPLTHVLTMPLFLFWYLQMLPPSGSLSPFILLIWESFQADCTLVRI